MSRQQDPNTQAVYEALSRQSHDEFIGAARGFMEHAATVLTTLANVSGLSIAFRFLTPDPCGG